MKKICDHPLLLTKKGAEGVLEGMDSMLNREEVSIVEAMAMSLANMTDQDSILQIDHNMSCKISFIMSLLVRTLSLLLVYYGTPSMLLDYHILISYLAGKFSSRGTCSTHLLTDS